MRRAICLASMAIRIFNWEKHDQIEEQLCRVIKNCYWWLEEKIDYEEHGDWVRLYFWKNSGVFDIDARRWGFLELTAFFLSGPFLLGEIKSTSRSKFMSPGAWERRSIGRSPSRNVSAQRRKERGKRQDLFLKTETFMHVRAVGAEVNPRKNQTCPPCPLWSWSAGKQRALFLGFTSLSGAQRRFYFRFILESTLLLLKYLSVQLV